MIDLQRQIIIFLMIVRPRLVPLNWKLFDNWPIFVALRGVASEELILFSRNRQVTNVPIVDNFLERGFVIQCVTL